MFRTTLFTLAAFVVAVLVSFGTAARADVTPVGPLPPGPVSTTTTARGQLVAVALPRAAEKTGLVWWIARPYDSRVVHQVSQADLRASVVLVFKVVGRGNTSLVFALTRGDTSSDNGHRSEGEPAAQARARQLGSPGTSRHDRGTQHAATRAIRSRVARRAAFTRRGELVEASVRVAR
jgi:hypothetical protein